MKLVELLARELDEWPEGAVYATQDKDMEVRFGPSCKPDFFATALAVDASSDYGLTDGCAIITREMWEQARSQLQQPTEWDGEGLPPIGSVCEVNIKEWNQCEVIAHFQQRFGMVAAFTVDIGDGAKMFDAYGADHFRPIRTEEQIAAQERERALDDIYRIIRTVERPGNKADMAEALYEAGYRKQEQSE